MSQKGRIHDGFEFLQLFEDAVDEVVTEKADSEVCEEIRRRVVDRVLREMKAQKQAENYR